MSMQQDIIDQVKTDLEAIGPYNVFEWRTTPINNSELPAIIVRDPFDSIDETSDDGDHVLTIELIILLSGNTSPADLRTAIEAVLTAFSNIETLSGVIGAVYIGGEKDSEQAKKKFMAAYLTCEVYYLTERWEI